MDMALDHVVAVVRFYLHAGRPWLAWATCGLHTFTLLPNFLAGRNLNYREITHLRHIPFLGESIAVAEGVPTPWMLVGQLTIVTLAIFVGDAGVTAWRRGERRKALIVSGSVVFFLVAGEVESALVFWGKLHTPLTVSLLFMGLVTAMGYELSRDVFRASQLVGELRESKDGLRENERRMSFAVDAANLGIWIRDLARKEIRASDKWRELFGFTPSEPLDLESILPRREYFRRADVRFVGEFAVRHRDPTCRCPNADLIRNRSKGWGDEKKPLAAVVWRRRQSER